MIDYEKLVNREGDMNVASLGHRYTIPPYEIYDGYTTFGYFNADTMAMRGALLATELLHHVIEFMAIHGNAADGKADWAHRMIKHRERQRQLSMIVGAMASGDSVAKSALRRACAKVTSMGYSCEFKSEHGAIVFTDLDLRVGSCNNG